MTARDLRPSSRGFTLVESLMAVVIVSGVLVAALGTFGAIGKARKNQVDRTAAYALANELLAEVMQCYFKEPGGGTALGPETGENARSFYDDVDDYDGYTSTPPKTRDGTALGGYSNWTHSVQIRCVQPGAPTSAIGGADPQALKQITVRVTTPGGMNVTVRGLRGVDGAYEQLPTSTTNYLTWTGVSAKVGESGKTVYGGAHPLNVTTSQ
jgi:prepilin-type N-terminal cleavage/methylation domain-containing protein